ncbi:ChbG/HpnK family deacetylase [Siccirubricoccus sp. KC 17139]|uniref:ChbG/HpnK family deacetylase n=1 Tax=Siccirubricoccus soli TaxID=2899147 RepID=A0ABT1D8N3_9PROT|nr:ChbG/HpnK family deacetylase [Siccirubricoccus soli]MCO6418296.1 ChbG/HpnK family deacetylase [Siccirubricoccus soli]MCP2684431.1 ChbG/HpnK family deacetylase [Siccirubricoccus soli]
MSCLLIINCDDLGVSHAANLAIHRALARGVATSASLMVPCPWAPEAVQLCRSYPLGIHLTYTSEYPACRWRPLTAGASLRDAAGFCHPTTEAAIAALDAAEAQAEGAAQIAAALAWGVDVTHLDLHMNVLQMREDLFEVYLDLASAHRLPVRILGAAEARIGGEAARARAAARGVLCNDHMLYPWPRPAAEVLREAAPNLQPGITEIFAHPVEDGPELRAYSPRFAELRAADAAGMADPALTALLEAQGIQRISYRQLRDRQRAG